MCSNTQKSEVYSEHLCTYPRDSTYIVELLLHLFWTISFWLISLLISFSLIPHCSGFIMSHVRKHGVGHRPPLWCPADARHPGLSMHGWEALTTPNRSKQEQNTQLAKPLQGLLRVPKGLEALALFRSHPGRPKPVHANLTQENLWEPPLSSCLSLFFKNWSIVSCLFVFAARHVGF